MKPWRQEALRRRYPHAHRDADSGWGAAILWLLFISAFAVAAFLRGDW